jgi:acetyltransferase-like isoleucine patch superfamily enzyme
MRIKYFTNIGFLWKGLLSNIAYLSIYPAFLCPLIHKIRGVKIGSVFNVYIASNVIIDSLFPELVTVEDEVYITRGVKILSHYNPTPPQQEIIGKDTIKGSVHIRRGAFIGVSSILLPNTTIGECALIAAGSVVTKNVPDFAIAAGNPAEIIGDIREHSFEKNFSDKKKEH